MAEGMGSGPVNDHPPPNTNSFPSATCAESHNIMVTLTTGRLQPVASLPVPHALRDDVYRRPLATALERLEIGPGWRVVDVGAGGGDVSVALAEIVGRDGRVYAVDSDPRARDEAAAAAATFSQVIAITQAGEDLVLPELVDLAFCRFLLMHVIEPAVVLDRMHRAVRPGGFLVAQEPVTSAGRVGGTPLSMPEARHPD